MNEIRYSHVEGTPIPETQTTQCSASRVYMKEALIRSAEDINDKCLADIATLITQRQFISNKILRGAYKDEDTLEAMHNTLDYINENLRKLLAL